MTDTNNPITHAGIIERAGGPARVSEKCVFEGNNVKAWKRNDSIPSGYWKNFVDHGLASYGELAEAAARSKAA